MTPHPTPLRQLPPVLEDWWMQQSSRATGKADTATALEALEPYVRQLSDLFTTDRPEQFRDYGQDTALRAAYGCFFFPQSFVRTAITVAELLDRFQGALSTEGTLRILDLGAGLGACGLGAIHALRSRGVASTVELVALDHSAAKLNAMKTLVTECFPPTTKLHTIAGDMRQAVRLLAAEPPFDLLICGFALNEVCTQQITQKNKAPSGEVLMHQLLKDWRKSLCQKGPMLVLEPALEATSRTLTAVSTLMISDSSETQLLPYYGRFQDPLTTDRHHWSHEVRSWASPASLRFLNRHLWRSIEQLKFSVACWIPQAQARAEWQPPPITLRLVSPFALLKGRFITTAVDNEGKLGTYDLPTRGMDKQTLTELDRIERGDTLYLANVIPLGSPQTFRIPNKEAILKHYHPS